MRPQLNAAGVLMFIRVYVPRFLYNLTLQLVQRVIKCICWKGHCLEDWTCSTALVENYLKPCPSDRSPSEGKTACQIMWWVITRTWTRVCFLRFQEQNRGCKPNSAPSLFFFILKSATHVITKWDSQNHIRLATTTRGPVSFSAAWAFITAFILVCTQHLQFQHQ